MDQFSAEPQDSISHNVELYTAHLSIQGTISGQFKRIGDLINRRDIDYLTVNGAIITPLGQASPANNRVPTPVLVRREHVHFAASLSKPIQPQGPGREHYVQKQAHACYALTDTFVIHGQCHLPAGATIEALLSTPDPFIPITQATVYFLARPNTPWQRDLLVVNRGKLEVFYLA